MRNDTALRISFINSRQSVQCTTIPYIASFAAIMIFTVQSVLFQVILFQMFICRIIRIEVNCSEAFINEEYVILFGEKVKY